MNKTWVLCDGNVEECTKEESYKLGGECRHTLDTKHAANSLKNRRFIKNTMGDNWEIEK